MPTPPLGDLSPDAEVLVTPIHLAGPGTRDVVFNILDSADGWTKIIAFGTDTYYTSPCQRVRIANALESRYGGWTVTYAEDPLGVPDWITTFDRNTPHEVVGAFTETLVPGLPNHFRDHLSGGLQHTEASPEDVLRQHGWEHVRGSRPAVALAPDGLAAWRTRDRWLHEHTELLTPEKSMWRLSAGADPIHVPAWRAYFSTYTPQHLRTAAATAIAHPDPVPRRAGDVPERHHTLIDVHTRKPPDSTARAQAATARSPHAEHAHTGETTVPSPPPSPTAYGRPRRQR
ncbi:DUF317 domain-containing protein [Actinomycetota bacterium Odt1-20B]